MTNFWKIFLSFFVLFFFFMFIYCNAKGNVNEEVFWGVLTILNYQIFNNEFKD